MQIKLGFSTGVFWNYNMPLKEILKILLEIDNSAVEVMLKRPVNLVKNIDQKTIDLFKKFKYRSIHAPCKEVKYPSIKGKLVISKLVKIADQVNAHTILFHPNNVADFNWLAGKVGYRLAFENLDNRNDAFGSVKEMKELFQKAPRAKFVFDLNHLYTHDQTMSLAEDFHTAFGDRLCHYHFSGYGGFHNCISQTKENIIFSGLMDLSKPIINEGASKNMKNIIHQDYQYILDFLTDCTAASSHPCP